MIFSFIGDVWTAITDFVKSPVFAVVVAIAAGIAVTVACAGTRGPSVAAVLSGMAAGAAGAGFYAAVHGANFGDVLTAAGTGAILGAVSGAIGYGIGAGANALLGDKAAAVQQGTSATWTGRAVSSGGRVLASGVSSGVWARLMGGCLTKGLGLELPLA